MSIIIIIIVNRMYKRKGDNRFGLQSSEKDIPWDSAVEESRFVFDRQQEQHQSKFKVAARGCCL